MLLMATWTFLTNHAWALPPHRRGSRRSPRRRRPPSSSSVDLDSG